MNKVHFILDEAASLGHLDAVDDAVDKYRGYGVRLQLYFQSMGQVKKCFPDGQDQTLLSNATQTFFGVNDNATADYVSARLGESTIVVESGGTSRGDSYQTSSSPQGGSSSSTSYNFNANWQQQVRKLLKPEEVMALPTTTAITFTPGAPPICTTLVRYYEEKHLGPPGFVARTARACVTVAASVALCVLAVACALLMTHIAQEELQSPVARSPVQHEAQDMFDR